MRPVFLCSKNLNFAIYLTKNFKIYVYKIEYTHAYIQYGHYLLSVRWLASAAVNDGHSFAACLTPIYVCLYETMNKMVIYTCMHA